MYTFRAEKGRREQGRGERGLSWLRRGRKHEGSSTNWKVHDTLTEFGIDIHKMRAQGCDGAANISGVHREVQAVIRQQVPEIVYCHCKAHSLNLAIGRACGEPLIRNMLTTVQTIAFAFDYSAKRLLAFQESLDQNVQVREEMDRRAKLRTLCETRWANRADAPSVQRSHSSFRCSRSCPGMVM